ncbi:iron chelate uptake ABC transporter family permease subunit, partial [Rhizobium johnstonii]
TRDRIIIFDIRLPSAILGFLIGASLAVSGTLMQGLLLITSRIEASEAPVVTENRIEKTEPTTSSAIASKASRVLSPACM